MNNYDQPYRPKFHFTPNTCWMYDPNGLIYNAATGEYHLYFQYNVGVMHHDGLSNWGHAVSKDLVHWTECPLALAVDDIGIIASGSAVIDELNTSGLFDDNVPPASRMVIIFTYFVFHGSQIQAIAYSTDNGYTWTKYAGNPVIANEQDRYGADFRDPKVIWLTDDSYAAGGVWLMVVGGGRVRLFTSPDLIHWTHNSDLTDRDGGELHSECPDLFPLAVDGDESHIKWVLNGAGRFYIVGDLVKDKAGRYQFVPTSDKRAMYGAWTPMYATQSFYNEPRGRRILINWLIDETAKLVEGKTWNGAQSVPLDTELKTINGEPVLVSRPIEELKALRSAKPLFDLRDTQVSADTPNILAGVMAKAYDVEITLLMDTASAFGFKLRCGNGEAGIVEYSASHELVIDLTAAGQVANPKRYSGTVVTQKGNQVTLRILVDESILDVYAQDGAFAYNQLFFPGQDAVGMAFYTLAGSVTIQSLTIWEMQTSWT